jgi:hypothetical protein
VVVLGPAVINIGAGPKVCNILNDLQKCPNVTCMHRAALMTTDQQMCELYVSRDEQYALDHIKIVPVLAMKVYRGVEV